MRRAVLSDHAQREGDAHRHAAAAHLSLPPLPQASVAVADYLYRLQCHPRRAHSSLRKSLVHLSCTHMYCRTCDSPRVPSVLKFNIQTLCCVINDTAPGTCGQVRPAPGLRFLTVVVRRCRRCGNRQSNAPIRSQCNRLDKGRNRRSGSSIGRKRGQSQASTKRYEPLVRKTTTETF